MYYFDKCAYFHKNKSLKLTETITRDRLWMNFKCKL